MKSLMSARINTVAVALKPDGWWVVRRTLSNVDGLFEDTQLEGPFAGEGAAEQRAQAIAIAEGDAIRAAKRKVPLKGRKGRSVPVDQHAKDVLARFIGTSE